MIFVTGDTHGSFEERFNDKRFPEQEKMTKDDYIIVCGDFGGVWAKDVESEEEKEKLDLLESCSFSVLFVDGNHENFDRLYKYPVKEWNGGKVHEIRPHILHLMRGQVFEINGKKLFAFGGAESSDIRAGILDPDDPDFEEKEKHLQEMQCYYYRINHVTWWEQELASEEEMNEGLANLEKHGFKVDYIITHCAPDKIQSYYRKKGDPCREKCFQNKVTKYLNVIQSRIKYKKWCFGHYHVDKNFGKELALYDRIEALDEEAEKIRKRTCV